ncbi:TonB-dependent receptor [Sphingomonas sp. DT-204]|uniref:TonB-dependent receptor n=1 Tax=Sphingomonas sp. DT-204 TaxID=3396166 RepID=UPI003F1AFB6E
MRGFAALLASGTALATAILAAAPALAQTPAQDSQEAEPSPEQDIIVTGVLNPRAIERAPISITAVTSEQLQQQAITSAADVLRTVPGVFVNNALGEIRNVVYSRGVSANSLDADNGYFYVSLQEDGLPVEPILVSNYGPDYFSRPDIMLSRLEALRGGTAAITGPNAPGGIFNYISRTGRSDPGTEIQAKVGLEGSGNNEYYRADAYTGGRIGSSELYYAVAGFYRKSIGARDPGFFRNRGGQVRGNLLWRYDSGSLLLTAKYLNDRNGFDEFIPAFGFKDPKIARPYDNTKTTLPGPGDHPYTRPDDSAANWNPKDAVHSRSWSVGANWTQEFGDNIRFENKARYSRNKSDWSVGAIISASSLSDLTTYLFTGAIAPGTLTFRFPDGSIAARANIDIGPGGLQVSVPVNNLPNQHILANGVETLAGYSPRYRGESFQDQFTLSAELGNHNLAIGGYYQTGTLRQDMSVAGYGLLTLEPDPQFLSITLDRAPAAGGGSFQVTSPTGFSNFGANVGGDYYDGEQETLSFVAGDSWQVTDRLQIEGGVRYERISYDITNATLTAFTGNRFAVGGADGNPATLYDNAPNQITGTTQTKRKFDFFNFSGSIAYTFSDNFNAYVRYTQGKKAPSFGIIQAIDTPAEIATQFPRPQKITQIEAGLKYRRGGIDIQAFPFYSKLSNVADSQTFVDQNGLAYTPPLVFGQIETYGVELQSNLTFGRFNLYSAVTIQEPKASGFSTWIQGQPTRDDDRLVTIPDGDADNNPKLIVRSTGTVKLTDALQVFATYNYLGKRAANRFNAFYLPGFSTVDLGASVEFGNFRVQANVNNLLNNYGILSYSRSGSIFASLDRQGLTPEAVAAAGSNGLIQVIPSQPRAFFLTATLKIK